MQICTAQMPIKEKRSVRNQESGNPASIPYFLHGFVIAEMVVVISLIGLFIAMALINIRSTLGKNSVENQAQDLAATFRMAAAKAAESSRRYEIVVDIQNQSYTFREISVADLGADILQEEIIRQRTIGNGVQIHYVQFDDGTNTTDEAARFRAGHAGWQYGGKVVLVDDSGNQYTIIINRLSKIVEVFKGEALILEPVENLAF